MSDDPKPVAESRERNTDAVSPDTPFSGENICRRCEGSGRLGSAPCPECGGTGKVVTPVGGAG
jgi:DnaJ-class molecular chaperone